MEFSRQEYYSGSAFSPPEDPPNLGIEPVTPVSPALQSDALLLEPQISTTSDMKIIPL